MTLKTLLLIYIFVGTSVLLALSYLMVKIQIKDEINRYEERRKAEKVRYNSQNFIGKVENFKY